MSSTHPPHARSMVCCGARSFSSWHLTRTNAFLWITFAAALCSIGNHPQGASAAAGISKYSCTPGQAGFSQHTCFGQTPTMRACRFRNLHYDTTGNGTWSYFENPDDPPEAKASGQSSVSYDFQPPTPPTGFSNATDNFFFSNAFVHTLTHEVPWGCGKGMGVDISLHRTEPPQQEQVLMQPGVSLIWNYFGFSDYSYGHCMLNDWMPMWLVMNYLFADAIPPFKIVMHGPHAPVVCLHYTEPFSQRGPAITFAAVIEEAKTAGKRWIRFCDLVVGDGGYQMLSIQAVGANGDLVPIIPPPMYNAGNWRLFRQAVYRAHGVDSVRIFDSYQRADGVHMPHITVLDSQKRAILNAAAVVAHLRLEFPHTNVSLVNFMGLGAAAQLHVMARTSVFVTTQGSASFRHVFLNRGASVIQVGSPLYAKSEDMFGYSPFFEVPEYFQVADYKLLKYPMDPAWPEWNTSFHKNIDDTRWDLYCIDIVLNISRITTFVGSALHEVARARQWLLDM